MAMLSGLDQNCCARSMPATGASAKKRPLRKLHPQDSNFRQPCRNCNMLERSKKSFRPMINKSAIAEKLSKRLSCDVSYAARRNKFCTRVIDAGPVRKYSRGVQSISGEGLTQWRGAH